MRGRTLAHDELPMTGTLLIVVKLDKLETEDISEEGSEDDDDGVSSQAVTANRQRKEGAATTRDPRCNA